MPKIEGGFSTKDPESMKKLFNAIVENGSVTLPFTATGWKSERNSHLVTGKKEKKKSIETPEEVEKYKDAEKEKKVVKEVKKIPVKKKVEKKKEVKKDTGDTTTRSVRGSPLGFAVPGSKKKTSKD